MTRFPAWVALLVLVAGCSGSADLPEGGATPAPSQVPSQPLTLVPFDDGIDQGTTLHGCAGLAEHQDEGYTLPILIWVRLRVAERLRLLPATYAERSNSIDSVTQYLGPDPGPEAPHLAVSIGKVGAGPNADRLIDYPRLIGDPRDSPAGLDAAQVSWKARVPLDRGVRVEPGDHYLFVEVDPAKGGMDLHRLTARWARDGKQGQQLIGSLSLRVRCGG